MTLDDIFDLIYEVQYVVDDYFYEDDKENKEMKEKIEKTMLIWFLGQKYQG